VGQLVQPRTTAHLAAHAVTTPLRADRHGATTRSMKPCPPRRVMFRSQTGCRTRPRPLRQLPRQLGVAAMRRARPQPDSLDRRARRRPRPRRADRCPHHSHPPGQPPRPARQPRRATHTPSPRPLAIGRHLRHRPPHASPAATRPDLMSARGPARRTHTLSADNPSTPPTVDQTRPPPGQPHSTTTSAPTTPTPTAHRPNRWIEAERRHLAPRTDRGRRLRRRDRQCDRPHRMPRPPCRPIGCRCLNASGRSATQPNAPAPLNCWRPTYASWPRRLTRGSPTDPKRSVSPGQGERRPVEGLASTGAAGTGERRRDSSPDRDTTQADRATRRRTEPAAPPSADRAEPADRRGDPRGRSPLRRRRTALIELSPDQIRSSRGERVANRPLPGGSTLNSESEPTCSRAGLGSGRPGRRAGRAAGCRWRCLVRSGGRVWGPWFPPSRTRCP
jgi:hypothetical protein